MSHATYASAVAPVVPEIRSSVARWRSIASQAQREMEELRLKLREGQDASSGRGKGLAVLDGGGIGLID